MTPHFSRRTRTIGPKVKPTVDAYTAVLPWYERADFHRLWELAQDHEDMPREYEVWYASALEVMTAWLARGRALQIVTIKPDEFLAWLEERGLPNTAATRLRFVENKARGGGATATAPSSWGVGSESSSEPAP